MATSAIHQPLQIVRHDSFVDVRVDQIVAAILIWANVFVCGADFRGQAGVEEFSIHWQILLRLGIAFVSGLAGLFWLFPKTYRDFLSGPGLLITLYCSWYGATLLFAVEMIYSFAALASLLGVLLFIPAAMRILGGAAMMRTVAFSLMCYIVGSWFAYIFIPSIGVYHEWVTADSQFDRMGGLGHPNELGLYSSFAILVFSGLAVSKQVRRGVAICCIGLAVITLMYCFSRTAVIACAFGLMFTLQKQLRTRAAIVVAVAAGCVLALIAFAVLGSGSADWKIEDSLIGLTKSGSTTELTTATGRTEIWAYGIGKIVESPLFGYGYCSGRFVMESHSYHCHNIVLNAALFGGFPGGLLLISILLYLAWSMFTRPEPVIDGLAACIMLGGMVDELIVSPSPSAAVFIWAMVVFWRQLGMQMQPKPGSPGQPEIMAARLV